MIFGDIKNERQTDIFLVADRYVMWLRVVTGGYRRLRVVTGDSAFKVWPNIRLTDRLRIGIIYRSSLLGIDILLVR